MKKRYPKECVKDIKPEKCFSRDPKVRVTMADVKEYEMKLKTRLVELAAYCERWVVLVNGEGEENGSRTTTSSYISTGKNESEDPAADIDWYVYNYFVCT